MSLPKDCPVGPQRKRTPKKNLEGLVVRECLAYLKQHSNVIYVERRNTGAVRFQDGGFIRFGAKGAADIWCLVRADAACFVNGIWPVNQFITQHIEIECKRRDGHGHLTPDQKRFQEFCNEHNIPYFVVTSAEELKKKIGAICT